MNDCCRCMKKDRCLEGETNIIILSKKISYSHAGSTPCMSGHQYQASIPGAAHHHLSLQLVLNLFSRSIGGHKAVPFQHETRHTEVSKVPYYRA